MSIAVTSNLRVNSLICPASRQWDINFLLPFLLVRDRQAILTTPIGAPNRPDRIVWDYSKNGIFTVRSGYSWIQSQNLGARDHRLVAARQVPTSLWRAIWKLEVPPKLRHFLWLSLHNCLPTCDAFFSRRSYSDPLCPICHCHDESLEHLFLLCPWVQPVWFGGALNYKVACNGINSWVMWLQEVFSSNFGPSYDKLRFQSYIAFTCWFIWKARCDFVFK